MGLKDFLFSKKEKNQFDSTTVVVNKDEINNDIINTNNSNNSSKTNIIRPMNFLESEKIANDLISGNEIIVDLTSTDIAEAKRIVDFLNGVTYAIGGSVKKVAKLVYLFSSKNK